MNVWREQYNVNPPEDHHDLVSFNVSIKVRSRVYSGVMQKIMDKLEWISWREEQIEMVPLRNKVQEQIEDEVWDRFKNRVWWPIWDNVEDKVRMQIQSNVQENVATILKAKLV